MGAGGMDITESSRAEDRLIESAFRNDALGRVSFYKLFWGLGVLAHLVLFVCIGGGLLEIKGAIHIPYMVAGHSEIGPAVIRFWYLPFGLHGILSLILFGTAICRRNIRRECGIAYFVMTVLFIGLVFFQKQALLPLRSLQPVDVLRIKSDGSLDSVVRKAVLTLIQNGFATSTRTEPNGDRILSVFLSSDKTRQGALDLLERKSVLTSQAVRIIGVDN